MRGEPLRILLVENYDKDSKIILNALINEEHWKIFQVNTLKIALEYLKKENYHVVLVDLDLPDTTHLEALELILKNVPHIPSIALAGKNKEDLALDAIAKGAQDYVIKEEINQYNLKRIIIYSIERNSIKNSIREREEKYRSLEEDASNWVWEIDETGEFTHSNNSVFKLLGYKPEEIIGKQFEDFVQPKEIALFQQLLKTIRIKKESFSDERGLLHKNGSTVIFEWMGVPVFSQNRTFAGFRGICRDITERRQIDEFIREKFQVFSSIVQNCFDLMVILDKDGLIKYINPAVRKILGFEKDDMIGKFIFTYIHSDDILYIVNILNNIDESASRIRFKSTDKGWHNMKISSTYLMENLNGLFLNAVDVSEFVSEIEVLKSREEKFREITEFHAAIICEVTSDMKVKYSNRKGLEILEYENSDYEKGLSLLHLIKEEDRDKASKNHEKILTGGEPGIFDLRIVSKTGKEMRSLVISYLLSKNNKNKTIWYTIIDIGQFCVYHILPDQTFYKKNQITQTESKIINLLIGGNKIRQIASNMCISEPTVKAHITNIYRKLNIQSREELMELIEN